MKYRLRAAALCAAALLLASCSLFIPQRISEVTDESASYSETSENIIMQNSAALANSLESPDEPFSSYTYDFSVCGSNYMITVTPDKTATGLELAVEDNQFGSSKFAIVPPSNYIVCLPYSNKYASSVCTVIKGADADGEGANGLPDLLKVDFYVLDVDNGDEDVPYTVSRLYSILDGRLVEVEVYDMQPVEVLPDENSEDGVSRMITASEYTLKRMDYIPESRLYRTEPMKFMPVPKVTVNEDGSLTAEVITYTLNPNDMTMRRSREKCSPEENPLYYGYAAYAVAGDIYKYFRDTSLNVSDYENYVETHIPDSEDSIYFFKADDPRFSSVTELRDYVSKYFDNALVNEMFRNAPQQYRDINGELYTILGDGGADDTLGKVTITEWTVNGNTITYHTRQEKYNSEHILDGYTDGGDFVIEVNDDGSFIVKKYTYTRM